MGGTSFLARSGEVVCWCVRHLYTHRTWKSRCRHATWRVFVTLLVRCRHRRLATGVLQLLWTRRVWCCSPVAGRRRLFSMSSFCPVIRTPCRKVSPSCHVMPISRARRLPPPSNNSGRIRWCGLVSSHVSALLSSWPSRDCLTSRDKSPNATPWLWHCRRKSSQAARMFVLSRTRVANLSCTVLTISKTAV